MIKRFLLATIFAIFSLSLAGTATAASNTWTEECPWFYYRDQLSHALLSKNEGWTEKHDNNLQRLYCGNARVFTNTNEMACMYGGVHKGGYPYRFTKPIPEGVTCERTGECEFTCTKATKLTPHKTMLRPIKTK
ncbi:MAG: hypothetical protein C4516_07745 [Oxalobacter sp.]|nr:MAG: hypothetical protein C4516_07745 [Oxalobacter sp.]